jgi:hypothetical protein
MDGTGEPAAFSCELAAPRDPEAAHENAINPVTSTHSRLDIHHSCWLRSAAHKNLKRPISDSIPHIGGLAYPFLSLFMPMYRRISGDRTRVKYRMLASQHDEGIPSCAIPVQRSLM